MQPGDIVLSLCGHDQNHLFLVLQTRPDFVLIADGRYRRIEKPKWKKNKHVRSLAVSTSPVAVRLRDGLKVTNREVHKTLTEYRETAGLPSLAEERAVRDRLHKQPQARSRKGR